MGGGGLPLQVCREADGFQPHLVSPEFGLRRLVEDAMGLVLEPTTTAVRRVHLLLIEATRWEPSSPPVCLFAGGLALHQSFAVPLCESVTSFRQVGALWQSL